MDFRPTERFSDRVADYVKYRPLYPEGVLDLAVRECSLTPQALIADIGSGPGNLSRLFVEAGYHVVGIEPNRPMRLAGDEQLADYPHFTSIEGTAEETALDDKSIDLITAGQAFHWFKIDETRTEFRRVLKPGAWVMLVWNDRNLDADALSRGYEDILCRLAPEYEAVRQNNSDLKDIESFFERTPSKATFPNSQTFDLEGFLGRATSSSYVPQKGKAGYEEIISALTELFEKEQSSGVVHFNYDTQVFYQQLG